MTNQQVDIELRVLGPLEVRVAGAAVVLGGAKQRAVLALLVLRAGEVVPTERLIDEVWGEHPPPSVAHSLEAYVSRLRRLLGGLGVSIARRGPGYALDLGGATLDAREFSALAEAAGRAEAEGEHQSAASLATDSLALWRGPLLADVVLGPTAAAEAERLSELRLRTIELRFDAELALGRDSDLIAELRAVVGEHPYRERFVSQLMLALYRAGRHAEALEVYERTRKALADDLGLQPSAELQQLSAQIVRHEPQLRRAPVAAVAVAAAPDGGKGFSGLLLAAAVAAAVLGFAASGSAPTTAAGAPLARAALVLPRSIQTTRDEVLRSYANVFGLAQYGANPLKTTTLVVDDRNPRPDELADAAAALRRGRFSLVMWVGDGAGAAALAPLVRSVPATRFVYVDASLETLGLEGVANATAIRFAEEEASELVGYLSGLISPRGRAVNERPDVVSVVAATSTPRVEGMIAGFVRGVRRVLPDAEVLVDYSGDRDDPTPCERLANSQIDRGSDVVFSLAGRCGSGAVAVARFRGVWAAADDSLELATIARDGAFYLDGPYLVQLTKDHSGGAQRALEGYELDRLPAGKDLVLGLYDDYAVAANFGRDVPSAVESKVISLCSDMRQRSGERRRQQQAAAR